MDNNDFIDRDKISNEPKIRVCRETTLKNILVDIGGDAFDTLDKIIKAGKGDLFASELMEIYDGEIDYDELIRILVSGDEAYELCGLNRDGTPDNSWQQDEGDEDEPVEEDVNEELQLIKGSAGDFDRMPEGFPTIVYTVNEDDPDWEEKLEEVENIVYAADSEIESYDIHLEGGFQSPKGGQEIELVIDPVYDDDEYGEDGASTSEEDKGAVMKLIDDLVENHRFRKIDFDSAEVECAYLPDGDIEEYDGDIGALRDKLASTHDFEEPREIKDYLEDAGFNVVDTDGGDGFEAWYEDPESGDASFIKFRTTRCWDDIYGPCCRLNESTFRIVHPKKTERKTASTKKNRSSGSNGPR